MWVPFTWLTWLALGGVALANPSGTWFRRSVFLDPDRRFHMEWETGDSQEIVFKLEVRTLGYVALGFSRDGTMVDSDFVVGWVSEGQAFLQDRYAEGQRMPELDEHEDYELISGSENATHTTLVFKRQWDTCDHQDFALKYDNTVRVLHAYSVEDPHDEINLPLQSSFSFGSRSLLLLQPEIPREENVDHYDLLTDDFIVRPEWDTLYWCKLFKVPNFGRKQHITAAVPLFLEGNRPQYVHHSVVYECANPDPPEYDQYLGREGYDCNDINSPSFTRECDAVSTIWSKGAEDALLLPENAGFPLEPNSYLMLQIHYDNVNRDTGSPGRAGIRYFYTPHLRQYDAGLLNLGIHIEENIMAPPGVRNFMVAGHMNPDCTSPAIPPEGVMMYSVFPHTHLIGRAIKTRHFRNNVELPPVVNDRNFDSEYQQPTIINGERLLLPQDQLTVECTYDSTGRNRTTLGGLSTRDEMCFSSIIYYPRFPVVYGSRSLVPEKTATRLLNSRKINSLTAGGEDYDQIFADLMMDYDWNRTAIRWLEDELRYAEQDTFCVLGTGDLNSVQTKISYPEGLQEYVEPPSRCVAGAHHATKSEMMTRGHSNERSRSEDCPQSSEKSQNEGLVDYCTD